MFRDRLNEEKKRLNISAKSMALNYKLHIPEETISRVLSGKTSDPGINTVLDLGETVGLAPHELFMDATLAEEFRAFLDLKSKIEETKAERIRIVAENESLKTNIFNIRKYVTKRCAFIPIIGRLIIKEMNKELGSKALPEGE